jgi:hypothetical protein
VIDHRNPLDHSKEVQMLRRVVLSLAVFSFALASPAIAADSAVTPISGCGAVVVLETSFLAASEQGQENIALHVPVTCAQ